jgi:hypothetical protein
MTEGTTTCRHRPWPQAQPAHWRPGCPATRCYQRRWRVLIARIVLLAAMNVLSSAVGDA